MKILLSVVLLVSTCIVGAEEWKSFDLLDGRLKAKMPAEAKIEARGGSVMAANKASRSETRVSFNDGEKQMVLMAWERFALAGPEHDKVLDKMFADWGEAEETSYEVTRPKKFLTQGVVKAPQAETEAILYGVMMVRHTDDSVQQLSVYFNPKYHENPEECRELMAKVFASVELGERELGLKGGLEVVDFPAAGKEVHVTLPQGYMITTQRGPDFVVHRIEKMAVFGKTGEDAGLYLGGHPRFHYSGYGIEEEKVTTRKEALFGEEVEWKQYSVEAAGGRIGLEAIADLDREDGNWKAHAFASAETEEALKPWLEIFRSFQVVSKKNEGSE